MEAREVDTAAGAPRAPAARRRASPSLLTSLRPFIFPVVVYCMSRVAVLSAAYFASFMKLASTPRDHTARAFTSGAGAIYRAIAQHGYPATVPARGPNPYGTSPLYPLVLRAANRISPLSPRETAIVVSTVLGLGAALGVWQVARSRFDRVTADRAVLLFCFLPGAYVLSFASPDSLLILLAVVCLLSLDRRRWVLAGFAGLLATATRPIGLALALVAIVAAVGAVRDRREWRALWAPALTISGWLAFVLYAALRTGHADTWFRAQRGGWSESFDAGVHFVYEIGAFLAFSRRDLSDLFFITTAAVVIGGLFILFRVRLPAIYTVYTIAVLAPALTSASPRVASSILVLAFPVVIAAARWLREEVLWAVAATLGSVMGLAVVWMAWKPTVGLL
jgi:hypothetical protein